MRFISPTYGTCENIEAVVDKIIERISTNEEAEWIVAIGSDSQNNGVRTKFCNAILVLEKGNGGTYFYSVHSTPIEQVIQRRMLKEAEMSIDIGKDIIEALESRLLSEELIEKDFNIKFEIHCDLGNDGKSKDSIKAAIGWISAEFGGLVSAKIKPDSPAASTVADKYTK